MPDTRNLSAAMAAMDQIIANTITVSDLSSKVYYTPAQVAVTVDWKLKYENLSKEFENYKENMIADAESLLGDEIYARIYEEVKSQIIKDVEVEAFKKARELYFLQAEYANDRI